jgi:hypothetical protein
VEILRFNSRFGEIEKGFPDTGMEVRDRFLPLCSVHCVDPDTVGGNAAFVVGTGDGNPPGFDGNAREFSLPDMVLTI